MMIAQATGLQAGDFIHTLGDAHIYLNHLDQVHTQLQRQPFELPTMHLNPDVKSVFDFPLDFISRLAALDCRDAGGRATQEQLPRCPNQQSILPVFMEYSRLMPMSA